MRYTYYSWVNGKYLTCTFAEFNNAFLDTEHYCREFYCDDEGNTFLNLVSRSNGKIYYKRKGVYVVCPKYM